MFKEFVDAHCRPLVKAKKGLSKLEWKTSLGEIQTTN